jgi:glycosyltransferase involved in cell wall biosynthesis
MGCGIARPPGDVHGLAAAVSTLLRDPKLAWRLGRQGRERVARVFTEASCLHGYRDVLEEVTSSWMAA